MVNRTQPRENNYKGGPPDRICCIQQKDTVNPQGGTLINKHPNAFSALPLISCQCLPMAGHYWNPEGRDVCSSHPKGEPLEAQSREETLENGPKRQTIKVSLHFSFKLKINFIWGTYPTKVVRNSVLQGRPLLHRANFFLHCIRTCC